MDLQWFVDLQEALVIIFSPISMIVFGVILVGSILAAIAGVILDVAGWLFKS
jgi:hypothetical protein